MASLKARTAQWKRGRITALIVAAVSIPIGAKAQDRIGVTVGAGGIFATDPPPIENFSEPLLIGSVQRVMKRYFVLEGDLSHWLIPAAVV